MNLRIVTDTDRARGWAELEIELLDSSRHFVRVHALDQSDLVGLAKDNSADALNQSLAKSLRVDRSFVGQISPEYLCAASAMLVLLSSGDVAGDAIVNHAAQTVFESSKASVLTQLAEWREYGAAFFNQLALLPKPPAFTKLPPELRAFITKRV